MGWTPLPEVGYGGAGDRPQSRHAFAHPFLRARGSLSRPRAALARGQTTRARRTSAAGTADSRSLILPRTGSGGREEGKWLSLLALETSPGCVRRSAAKS